MSFNFFWNYLCFSGFIDFHAGLFEFLKSPLCSLTYVFDTHVKPVLHSILVLRHTLPLAMNTRTGSKTSVGIVTVMFMNTWRYKYSFFSGGNRRRCKLMWCYLFRIKIVLRVILPTVRWLGSATEYCITFIAANSRKHWTQLRRFRLCTDLKFVPCFLYNCKYFVHTWRFLGSIFIVLNWIWPLFGYAVWCKHHSWRVPLPTEISFLSIHFIKRFGKKVSLKTPNHTDEV